MTTRTLPVLPHTLRMVAWEVTRSCNLACVHCRASALRGPYAGEFDTGRCLQLLEDIAVVGRPVVILTGGEPLLRDDIYEIAAYGDRLGLRMVMATNGTLLTVEVVERLRSSGIKRVSISIDGEDAPRHDAFRGVAGAFAGALYGIEALRRAGLEFQINTTITQVNVDKIPDIHELALRVGAAAHHIFLLVPTGRGKELADQEISPERYEDTLHWFHERSLTSPIQLKATCAPHYYRIIRQKGRRAEASADPLHAMTRGCLGGSSFCFISHAGQVQPCGYLEIDCGRIGERSFADIWEGSPELQKLRDLNLYEGKCGRCEFIRVCGGCRARAYETTGNYLSEEPFCVYEPRHRR